MSEINGPADNGGCELTLPQHTPAGYSNRVVPRHDAYSSYAVNRLVVFTDGGPLWFEAGEEEPEAASKPGSLSGWPEPIREVAASGASRWTYVSAWNPDGKPSTKEQNDERHQQLISRLDGKGLAWLPAVTVGANNEWFEAGVVILDADDELAAEIAAEFEQSGWITIGARWQTGSRYLCYTSRHYSLIHLGSRPNACPVMMVGSEGEQCRMVGGPYGSAAMEAAAYWSLHRRIGVELLGCGVCGLERSQEPPAGPIIYLREMFIGSRYGGYAAGGRLKEPRTPPRAK